MQLRIRQRIFSWTDSYDVCDEDGNPRFEVRGALFSIGHRIHVYDKRTGEELGYIRQKLLTILPAFEIVMGGQVQGTIYRKFTVFRQNYQVDFRGWDVEGDFLGWEYSVRQGAREVLRVSKEIFRLSDTYVLQYQNSADELPGLLLVLAIDAANCTHND